MSAVAFVLGLVAFVVLVAEVIRTGALLPVAGAAAVLAWLVHEGGLL